MIGEYRNAGTEWARAGQPVPVRTHDFPDERLGKAIPYGVYDVSANTGWVNVGIDHDTSAWSRCGAGGTRSAGTPIRRPGSC